LRAWFGIGGMPGTAIFVVFVIAGEETAVASREEAQTALARVLIEKIRQDPYPSSTQMTILEQTIPPPLMRDYLNVLLEKVLRDSAPSIPMLRRIQRVTEQL
jgi:hypothetical protein